MKIELVDLDKITPAAYNPRLADESRLALLRLSLQTMGFILPIYATSKGEILSGHQRHLVAGRLGFKKVPVVFLPKSVEMNDSEIKGLNILFNRGTNDFNASDTTQVAKTLSYEELADIASSISVKNKYRCISPLFISPKKIIINNPEILKMKYSASIARSFRTKDIVMPAILTNSGKIVNGGGRLLNSAEKGEAEYPCVIIGDDEPEFASSLLNKLTMDFCIEEKYKDLLRYNSFRRSRRVREDLGRGFVFAVIGSKPSYNLDLSKPADLQKWKKVHGQTVLDFGAGHLTETNILRKAGINCIPFEPYHILPSTETISKPASLKIVDSFLAAIASGIRFDSIFISSVLNSVPFEQDRKFIVAICHSLCEPRTKLFAVASTTSRPAYKTVSDSSYSPMNDIDANSLQFKLDYEPGIVLGDYSKLPKVQKYHTQKEFFDLFSHFFNTVEISEQVHNVQCIASNPKKVDKQLLLEAINFEFNLPYPNDDKMGKVQNAIASFRKRGVL